jgi:GTP pyrophosphokinase
MGKGVSVHKADCINLLSSDPKRWIDVSWSGITEKSYKVSIHISAENQRGIFAEISGTISADNANIVDISAHTTATDLAEMTISLEVVNLEHLQTLLQHLRQVPAVIAVRRL